MAKNNPQLINLINQNQEEFMSLLNDGGDFDEMEDQRGKSENLQAYICESTWTVSRCNTFDAEKYESIVSLAALHLSFWIKHKNKSHQKGLAVSSFLKNKDHTDLSVSWILKDTESENCIWKMQSASLKPWTQFFKG